MKKNADNPTKLTLARSTITNSISQLKASTRYLTAVLSQSILSGFHFAVNLILVKLLSIEDFGIFALTFVGAVLTSSISNALVSTPLSVYGPATTNTDERNQIEKVLCSIMVLLLGTILGVGLFASMFADRFGIHQHVLVGALLFIVSYALRQYSRNFGYSRFDVITVLRADIMYVITASLILLVRFSIEQTLGVLDVLISLILANITAVAFEFFRLTDWSTILSSSQAWKDVRILSAYNPIWLQSRWALVGSVTTIIVSQAHSILVSATKGPAAYAPLAAGFVIFGPVRLISTTIQNVVKPEMSRAISLGNIVSAQRQSIIASGISLLAVTGLIVLIQLAWPMLEQWLYADKYSHVSMKMIVFFWAAIALISAAQNGPSAALQSLKEFKSLAIVTVYGSVLSLIMVASILGFFPISFSIIGIMLAELFVTVWIIVLTIDCFRSHIRVNKNNSQK